MSYGADSDDEKLLNDEEDDLFAADDDDENGGMNGLTAQQKAKVLRLKREQRVVEREEQKKAEKHKRAHRMAFELVNNFCQRFNDWKLPFNGSTDLDCLTHKKMNMPSG